MEKIHRHKTSNNGADKDGSHQRANPLKGHGKISHESHDPLATLIRSIAKARVEDTRSLKTVLEVLCEWIGEQRRPPDRVDRRHSSRYSIGFSLKVSFGSYLFMERVEHGPCIV
ncbi:hypothetical protein AAHA92_12920 [Salvia divinorum]|uniref:Uncharacterized protein n=1 Tax=Salvia divinorum TaxID=28513 RepID=A0ABD1H6M6_SALDI